MIQKTGKGGVNLLNTAFFALLFLGMFILTLLTPKFADDFSYCFSFATDQRITSVLQIFPSMETHRELLNGRVIPHFLVQLFLMMPKAVFCLFNGLNALMIVYLVSRMLQEKHPGLRLCTLLCGVMGIWIFSPSFGENYLWLDGSVNYSWALSILMLFLWPFAADYMMIRRKKSAGFAVSHAVLSFAAGAWSENGSLSMILLALCLTVLCGIREKKYPFTALPGILCACGGYLFLMLAPASRGRAAPLEFSAIANNLMCILQAAKETLLPLYVTYALLLVLVLLYRGKRERVVFSLLLLLSGFAALFSFVFAAYFVKRHFSCTVFLTVTACLLLMDELFSLKKPKMNWLILGSASVVFFFSFLLGSMDILSAHRQEKNREQIINETMQSGARTITLVNSYTATGYALPFILDAPDNWINMTVASYYGMEAVYGLDPAE